MFAEYSNTIEGCQDLLKYVVRCHQTFDSKWGVSGLINMPMEEFQLSAPPEVCCKVSCADVRMLIRRNVLIVFLEGGPWTPGGCCLIRARTVHTFGYCLLPRFRAPDFFPQNWVLHGCCRCRTAIQLLVDHPLPPFLKISFFPFPKFAFFLLSGAFCWLSATVRGGGFFAQKWGCETMPWHS